MKKAEYVYWKFNLLFGSMDKPHDIWLGLAPYLWRKNRNLDVSHYNLVVHIMNQKTVVPFNPLMKRFKRDKRMILTSSLVEKSKQMWRKLHTAQIFPFIKKCCRWSLAKSLLGGRIVIFELWRTPLPRLPWRCKYQLDTFAYKRWLELKWHC